jgi:two-component system, chemotaxis family, response regulator WspF
LERDKKIRIAIVDDMIMGLEILRRILGQMPEHDFAWMAQNGEEALEKAVQFPPDLILMDLVMPVMNGVEATRRIMQHAPCAILIVTASTQTNVSMVYEAMGYGALDAVNKPVIGIGEDIEGAAALITKIRTIEKLIGDRRSGSRHLPDPVDPGIARRDKQLVPLILIGSSTGGPQALATILAKLPSDMPAAIIVAQHVDVDFAPGLVQWLQTQTTLSVQLAENNEAPRVGVVYIAGTSDHLVLNEKHLLNYTPHPKDYHYRPSVNELFTSAAKNWHFPGTAVLLTGMGYDGAQGLLALKEAGWRTIAQDKLSSVIYGMPRAAAKLGAAQDILSLDHIAAAIKNGILHLN